MQIPPQKISYEDDSWEYLFEPSFFDRKFLEPEMDELYGAIAGFMHKEPMSVQYPPDQILKDEWTVHDFLFVKTQSHLEKIATFFRKTQDVKLDVEKMTIVSRHHFFFYTQPVMVLGDNNLRMGLSGLQVLMGLNHPTKPSRRVITKKEKDERPITTGNMRARIIAAALLSKIPPEVMERVGMAELLDIIAEAGNLMRDPKDNKEKDAFIAPSRAIAVDKSFDADLWDENKDWIKQAIADKGINVPDDF